MFFPILKCVRSDASLLHSCESLRGHFVSNSGQVSTGFLNIYRPRVATRNCANFSNKPDDCVNRSEEHVACDSFSLSLSALIRSSLKIRDVSDVFEINFRNSGYWLPSCYRVFFYRIFYSRPARLCPRQFHFRLLRACQSYFAIISHASLHLSKQKLCGIFVCTFSRSCEIRNQTLHPWSLLFISFPQFIIPLVFQICLQICYSATLFCDNFMSFSVPVRKFWGNSHLHVFVILQN